MVKGECSFEVAASGIYSNSSDSNLAAPLPCEVVPQPCKVASQAMLLMCAENEAPGSILNPLVNKILLVALKVVFEDDVNNTFPVGAFGLVLNPTFISFPARYSVYVEKVRF